MRNHTLKCHSQVPTFPSQPGPYSNTLARNWAQLTASTFPAEKASFLYSSLTMLFSVCFLKCLICTVLILKLCPCTWLKPFFFFVRLRGYLCMDVPWYDDSQILVSERNNAAALQQALWQEQATYPSYLPDFSYSQELPEIHHLFLGHVHRQGKNVAYQQVMLRDDAVMAT